MRFRSMLAISLVSPLMILAGSVRAQDYTPMSREGYPQSAQTVTNGQAVTLSAGVNILTSAGGANATTNTITLANGSVSNVAYWLVNADASTNLIALAKTGNWKAAAVELAAGEALYVIATATNAYRRGDAGAALAARVTAAEAKFSALGATNIAFKSTLQTNTLYFNASGILTNHAQVGP